MQNIYHIPVLAEQSVAGLNIKPDGIYADITFGGGGHSELILKKLNSGKLIAFDQDPDAQKNAEKLKKKYGSDKFIFVRSNFMYLKNFLQFYNALPVDGILADLGVSSYQIDTAERGFSFMHGVSPDMRMNKNSEKSAADIINNYSEQELYDVFKNFAEIKNPFYMVRDIVAKRIIEPVKTVEQLNAVLQKYAPKNKEYKFFAKVYQALRIETNNELEALKIMLMQSVAVLKKGGRLSVITYHSLEDRLVKNFIKSGNFAGDELKDVFGNKKSDFVSVNKKIIQPDNIEIQQNPRARSAKLRIAEKL